MFASPTDSAIERKTAEEGTRTLLVLTLLHFVVDAVAAQLSPLWPELAQHYSLGGTRGGTFWLLLVWMLATSFSQLAFGLIGDSPISRALLWLGPVLGAVCLGAVGLSSSAIILFPLLICGGLGIAAFHPEGAALAGGSWPASRSRAMSIFATGGFLGQAFGPSLSGWCVDHFELRGLAYGIGISLPAIAVLRLGHRETASVSSSNGLAALRQTLIVLRRQREIVGMLLIIGSLRVIAASGVPIAISYWLTSQSLAKAEIGLVQSCFLGGIGLGGLLCATFVTSRSERLLLWLCPLLSVPFLMAIPLLAGLPLKLVTFVAALFQGIALPVFISYGQQLLPESQRVASSITMGVSWGIGGAIVAQLIEVTQRDNSYWLCFQLFGVAVLLSCLLCVALKRPQKPATSSELVRES